MGEAGALGRTGEAPVHRAAGTAEALGLRRSSGRSARPEAFADLARANMSGRTATPRQRAEKLQPGKYEPGKHEPGEREPGKHAAVGEQVGGP